jgi:hypothetical protein
VKAIEWHRRRSRAQRRLRVGPTIRLSVLAVAATTALVMMMVATAAAENPVYCEGTYLINKGCNGPNGPLHDNEARELELGCVSVQDVVEGEYGPVKELCGGAAGGWELTSGHGGTTYPRCWDRTSPEGRIRCRYSEW